MQHPIANRQPRGNVRFRNLHRRTPISPITVEPRKHRVARHLGMLSRVAESVYWMSRYVERAENVSRFIDVNLNLTLDLGTAGGSQWAPLVYTTGDHQQFLDRYHDFTQEKVIQFLTFDEKNPNSILSCLRAARENARTVREVISSAMWEEINKFYLMVSAAAVEQNKPSSPFDFFNQIKLSSHMLQGVTDATMSHGEAWHFARIGRLLERADKTSRILDVKYFVLLPNVADVGTPLDSIQWAALLKRPAPWKCIAAGMAASCRRKSRNF